MSYPEYKGLDLAQVNREILSFWKEHGTFEKSVNQREGKPSFVFYEGPPSANGKPGIHHVMARTIKDLFCRYKTLKGFQVKRKAGWDTHGLPVELQVEKELGIKKEDIGKKISIADYNRRCRETVMQYTDLWNRLTEEMGYWVDLNNPYITYDNKYIETLWFLLKELYKKGLLYKGYTIQPYSPAAGTGLSSHELNYPGTYKEVSDTSVVAQFKVKRNEQSAFLFDDEQEEVFFLAWTTTPWTLPSNMALAVGEDIDYVKVRTFNPYTHRPVSVILAKDRLPAYFSKKAEGLALSDYQAGDKLIPYEIAGQWKGKDLAGIRYEQLLPFLQKEEWEEKAFRVIIGDFVSTEDGTGIVHISPTFGADDARVAKQNGVPAMLVEGEDGTLMPTVDKEGKFIRPIGEALLKKMKELGIRAHKEFTPDDFYVKNYLDEDESQPDYKSTDVILAIILKEENKAFKVEKYVHSYPHCWRTGKPVLYYPLDSWFIRTTALKDRMVELNKTINWKPASTGEGRFGNWLENLVDWNLSRSRYWGTPLPVWRTEDGSEEKCIGSLEELRAEIQKANERLGLQQSTDLPDLHRPYVDEIVLVSDSGKPMHREPDLIDVWFDSGAMPYAQWHYPFENQEEFKRSFPADFISEGVDQTRGWFFTLHALAVMLFDSVAFKNVVSTGLVLDKNGDKMSKSKGNVIDPFETIGTYGADATRWYMVSNAAPWENLRFDLAGVDEVKRKFFGTLYNTYSFFALYANLDGFAYKEATIPVPQRPESDRWIISRLNTLISTVEQAMEDYEPTKATRAIQHFVVEDLSNWYVRLNRKRFWKGEYNQDKIAAYQTLYECLVTVAKLASPFAPFYAERLYKDLNDTTGKEPFESVHLTDFPQVEAAHIDRDLEEKMDLAQRISSLTHALRKREKIKVRQPLHRILIPVLNDTMRRQIEEVADIIKAEVNVKAIEFVDDSSGILVKTAKPNFRRLGQTYKQLVKPIAAAIQQFGADEIRALEQHASYDIEVEGQTITLTQEDVIIESKDIEGWSVASERGLTVALDTRLDDALLMEGIARDVVNRIQNLRKDLQFEVQDKIAIHIQRLDELFNRAIETHKPYIMQETQALQLELVDELPEAHVFDLDGRELRVAVSLAEAMKA
ncbi:MAG: isoleucine--tRNA ligase [Thermonema sp.]|uniref:isoleucine--tRNA ligase n=1 Tax=Thermonema sp. TaxID=2231181 RepID=UPI0021DE44DA|nr:isoleucine--tRNA ligase [Thermonema sp.]GIV39937.1 MAG: isoleucine--tRNA ligase [Thermonema sp.]